MRRRAGATLLVPFVLSAATVGVAPAARAQDKFFGSIWKTTSADPLFGELFDQTTPENAGKWGIAEPTEGAFVWDSLDAMYAAAGTIPLATKQHCFIWGQQQPSWVTSANAASAAETWMSTYMARYGSGVDTIDVVNEPLHATPSYRDGLGGDGSTGWDWVIWSFEKARMHAPNASLLINEYDVLKSDSILNNYMAVCQLLKDRGLLDGIGVQGHFLEGVGASVMQTRLDSLAELGLPIYVSEYDVDVADDAQQSTIYQGQFPVMWEHPAVAGITLWGHREGQIWRTNAYLIRTDGSERPALTWLRGYLATHRIARPTGLTARATDATSVQLGWTDASDNETGFEVQRGIGGGAWTLAASVATDATSYTDTGLTPATDYAYRVRAVTADAASAWSGEASATTGASGNQAPVVDTPPSAAPGTVVDGWSATLSVGAHDPDADALVYVWSVDSGQGGAIFSVNGTSASTSTSVTPDSPGAYTFLVTVSDGNLEASASVSVTVLPSLGDHDTDGMPNWWEATYGLDPASSADASQDPDSDGVTNLDEYLAGTDPNSNPDSDSADWFSCAQGRNGPGVGLVLAALYLCIHAAFGGRGSDQRGQRRLARSVGKSPPRQKTVAS